MLASEEVLLLEARYACKHQHHRDCTKDCPCPHDGSSSGKMLIDREVLTAGQVTLDTIMANAKAAAH
jgi:hypothetical protein